MTPLSPGGSSRVFTLTWAAGIPWSSRPTSWRHRLSWRLPDFACDVPCYPLTQHLAEKVHAYVRPRSPGKARVKDLVDIILIAENMAINLALRTAIPGHLYGPRGRRTADKSPSAAIILGFDFQKAGGGGWATVHDIGSTLLTSICPGMALAAWFKPYVCFFRCPDTVSYATQDRIQEAPGGEISFCQCRATVAPTSSASFLKVKAQDDGGAGRLVGGSTAPWAVKVAWGLRVRRARPLIVMFSAIRILTTISLTSCFPRSPWDGHRRALSWPDAGSVDSTGLVTGEIPAKARRGGVSSLSAGSITGSPLPTSM